MPVVDHCPIRSFVLEVFPVQLMTSCIRRWTLMSRSIHCIHLVNYTTVPKYACDSHQTRLDRILAMEWRWSVAIKSTFHRLQLESWQIPILLRCIRMHTTYRVRPSVANYYVLQQKNVFYLLSSWNMYNWCCVLHPRVRVSSAFGTQFTMETHWPDFVDHILMWSSRYKPYR